MMENSKKILVFFIVICILFWNPIVFYLFYSNSEIYETKVLRLLFWAIPFLGILLIFVIRSKKSLSKKFENLIFGISFFGIFFAFLVILNSLIGSFVNSANTKKGLIFEPNTIARYKTVEFDITAKINDLGLRNREIRTKKENGKFRILCFGDSWTFGWGVDVKDSWPMQMESFLHSNGFTNVEVINCGKGGQTTSGYKENMSKAVPLLKPDLVLVGVLQLDDLAQLFENNFQQEIDSKNDNTNLLSKIKYLEESILKASIGEILSKVTYAVNSFLKASFSNYLLLFSNQEKKEIDIKSSWSQNSNNMIHGFSPIQRIHFSTLSDTVQTLFKTGNLNSFLLDYYINFPEGEVIFNNPNHSATKYAINLMDKDLKDMKNICETNEVKIVFINLPENTFTGHKVNRTPSDVLNNYFMTNNKIDSIYQNIASNNQINYLQLTQHFKDLLDKEKYFFKFDGHPNENGYREIAVTIGEYIINYKLIN